VTPSGASAARALGREHELLAELEARLPRAAAFSQQFSPAVRDALPFYRWFVWPGFGRRSAHRYGALIGTRRFVVVGRPPARSRAEGTPR
jgi:hypothetical protein